MKTLSLAYGSDMSALVDPFHTSLLADLPLPPLLAAKPDDISYRAEVNGDAGDNTLNGTDEDDTINGLGGDDIIVFSLGADVIDGGEGTDTFRIDRDDLTFTYFVTDEGLNVRYSAAGVPRVTQILTNFEVFEMGDGRDNFQALQYDRGVTIMAGGGNDILRSTAFADVLDGGDDIDSYSAYDLGVDVASQALVADLATGIVSNDGAGNEDRLSNIENIVGTRFSDTISGTDGNNSIVSNGTGNIINARGGDDTITVNGAGTFDGGDGIDSLRLNTTQNLAERSEEGLTTITRRDDVYINLETGQILADGFGGSGTIQNIEHLTITRSSGTSNLTLIGDAADNILVFSSQAGSSVSGGAGNDVIIGDLGRDVVNGGTGNDFIYTGQADDIITASLGQDIVFGGAGRDIVIFDIVSTAATVVERPDGTFQITRNDGLGSVTLLGVEEVVFSDDVRVNTSRERVKADFGPTVNSATLVQTSVDVLALAMVDMNLGTLTNTNAAGTVTFGRNDDVYNVSFTGSGFAGDLGSDLSGGIIETAVISLDGEVLATFSDLNADIATLPGLVRQFRPFNDQNDALTSVPGLDAYFLSLDWQMTSQADGIRLSNTNILLGDDIVTGTAGNDIILSGEGNDIVNGLSGNDRLTGRNGNDRLEGGLGQDILDGSAGQDTLIGDAVIGLSGIEGRVVKAYLAILGRLPEKEGFQNFVNEIRLGQLTEQAFVDSLIGSAEFTARFGSLQPIEFLERAYEVVFQRPPDAEGFNGFRTALESGSLTREQVIIEFLNSPEFVQTGAILESAFANSVIFDNVEGEIFRAYTALLGRDPDEGGFRNFVRTLQNGVLSYTDIVTEFIASNEFTTTYGALSNQAFIDLLFQNVLPNNMDQGGRTAFVNALDAQTLTRPQAVEEILQSFEFRAETFDATITFVRSLIDEAEQDTLIANQGQNLLIGGQGRDLFRLFMQENLDGSLLEHTIADFVIAGGATDVIDINVDRSIEDQYDSFEEIIAFGTQSGNDTVFDFGTLGTLTLNNVNLTDLTPEHFGFDSNTGQRLIEYSDDAEFTYEFDINDEGYHDLFA